MTISTKDKDDLVATLRDVAAKLGDISDRLGIIGERVRESEIREAKLARERELHRAMVDLQTDPVRQRP